MRFGHVLTIACLFASTLVWGADAPKSALPALGSAALEARFRSALALYAHGVALGKRGDADEANRALDLSIDELRAVIQLEPRAWVYYSLGQALRRRGELDAAIVAYRSALDRISEERLPDRAKLDFLDRTKQQIGACMFEKPRLEKPTIEKPTVAAARPSGPLLPVAMPAPELELVTARPPRRTRYSVAVPAALAAVGGGLLVAGGSLYGVSGARYDNLITDGCGSTRACDDAVFGGVRTMERAGIGLMIAGGVVLAADIALWAAWRRR